MHHLLLVFLGVYTCAITLTHGRNIYVDQNHSAATDNGQGTKTYPFKTLRPACRLAKAGDVVHVYDGVYREALVPKHSGKYGRPVVFQAEGPNVWIKGSNVVTNWEKEGNLWVKRPWRKRYYYDEKTMDEISDARFHASARQEQIFIEGKPLQWFPEKKLIETNGFYWAPDGSEIAIKLPEGWNPNKMLVEIPIRPAVVAAWPEIDSPRSRHEVNIQRKKLHLQLENFPKIDWVVIRGFKFAHNVATLNRCGVRIQGRHWFLENNLIEWMNTVGIGVDDWCVIRRNITCFNGQSGIGHFGSHVLLDGNISLWDNQRNFRTNWGGGSIKLCTTEHVLIRKQIILGSTGPGIWFDIDARDTTIEDCVIFPNSDTKDNGSFGGILYEISYQANIRNNVIFGNHDKCYFEVYGAGIVISNSLGVKADKNVLFFCDGGFGLIGGQRKDKRPGDYMREYGLDAYHMREIDISKNLIMGDLLSSFDLYMRYGFHLSSWINSSIFNNDVVASNSEGKVRLDTRTFSSMRSAQDSFPWLMSGNRYFPTLYSTPGTVSSRMDWAALRMLNALRKIVNFPTKLTGDLEIQKIWKFDHTLSQGLFLKVGNQYVILIDNPRPVELQIGSASFDHIKMWDSSEQSQNFVNTKASDATFKFGKGLGIIIGLSKESRPLPSKEIK